MKLLECFDLKGLNANSLKHHRLRASRCVVKLSVRLVPHHLLRRCVIVERITKSVLLLVRIDVGVDAETMHLDVLLRNIDDGFRLFLVQIEVSVSFHVDGLEPDPLQDWSTEA